MRKLMDEKATLEEGVPASSTELTADYPGPQRELDLHEQTQEEATFSLRRFIENAVHQRVRTLRVITGKGLHSRDARPVLLELVARELAGYKKSGQVLHFRKEKTGGSYIVYLVS